MPNPHYRRQSDHKNQTDVLRLIVVGAFALILLGCDSSADKDLQERLLRAQRQREKDSISNEKSREERLVSASSYLREGNPVSAESELRPLLLTNPDDAEVLILVARAQAIGGQKREAIQTLLRLQADDADLEVESKQLISKWSIDLEAFEKAEEQLKQILQFPGNHVDTLRTLSGILNNQGHRREAADYLVELAKTGQIKEKELIAMVSLSDPFTDPDFPTIEVSQNLSKAMLYIARENRDRELHRNAIALCKQLLEEFPNSTEISAFLGRLYADQQNVEQLRNWLGSVPTGIQIEPEYWHALATLMELEGRPNHAIRCLLETVIRDQTDWLAYLKLARTLHLLGQESKAKIFQMRAEQIKETKKLAISLGQKRGTPEQLLRLADLMNELNRPWESFAWRRIGLKQRGASREALHSLEESRVQLLQSSDDTKPTSNQSFLLSELDLNNWPLPDLELIQQPVNQVVIESSERQSNSPLLVNIAEQTGLRFQYNNGQDPNRNELYIHQVTGGGIGVVDFDLDGWPDLYFSQGGGDAFNQNADTPDQVFRNIGGEQWISISQNCGVNNLGYAQGVAVADLNQDGWQDLVVANLGQNVFYQNNGDGSFSAVRMPKHPRDLGGWTTSIACGDITGDDLPEIFEVNYLDDPTALNRPCGDGTIACNPINFQPAANHVFSIQQDGSIKPSSVCAGIEEKANFGFGIVIANVDHQEGNDVFIANDTQNNHLWISQPKTKTQTSHQLIESASILGCAVSEKGLPQGCMGIAFGDFDRNHSIDFYVSNFWKQAADLYLLQKHGSFASGNYRLGLYEDSVDTVGWGSQTADFDHDGWLDIAVLNGHVTDLTRRGQAYRMRPQLFRGSRTGFELARPNSNDNKNYWSQPSLGRTLAMLDWNRDGRMDLVANHLDRPAALLENQTDINQKSSIQLELVGTNSERDAIGATVHIQNGDESWSGWQTGGDGFLCSNQNQLHFGTGATKLVESLRVRWPSGTEQIFEAVKTNQSYLLIEGQDELVTRE